MRAIRFRGLACSFVVVSRNLLVLPTHFIGGGSLLCPKGLGIECRLCPGLAQRFLGYCAVREVGAAGQPGELHLAELPESLLRVVGDLLPAPLAGPALLTRAHGVAVIASRRAVRRPWDLKKRGLVDAKTTIEDGELFDAVARLYQLPLDAEARRDDFDGRFRLAVVARHDMAVRGIFDAVSAR